MKMTPTNNYVNQPVNQPPVEQPAPLNPTSPTDRLEYFKKRYQRKKQDERQSALLQLAAERGAESYRNSALARRKKQMRELIDLVSDPNTDKDKLAYQLACQYRLNRVPLKQLPQKAQEDIAAQSIN